MNLPKPFAIVCSLFVFGLLSLAAPAEQQRHPDLHPVTLVRTLDALRDGRRHSLQKKKTKKSEQYLDDPFSHLRRVQEDDTCEAALAEAEVKLAVCEAQEEVPKYLAVQMADKCIFDTTDSGNLVLKSRHFHGDTVKFSDRPFTYEKEVSTESFFDDFDDIFNADNGGKPNAAITLVQNDESKDIVVSVLVKAVVKHRDDPDGPTFVYKLEQSDDQASVESLSDVMGGKDKMTYDHCSIFIDGGCDGCGNCGKDAPFTCCLGCCWCAW